MTGVGGVPATGVGSVVLNVTVTGGTAPSHLTACRQRHEHDLDDRRQRLGGLVG
ncbi:MAG: hypothetical protein R2699_01865 [Acidimicrobiales bacterium]